MAEVRIHPGNLVVHVATGTPLKELLLKEGILLDFPCGGRGACQQCKISVDPPTESGMGGKSPLPGSDISEGRRLACRTRIEGDCAITIPEGRRTEQAWHADLPDKERHVFSGQRVVARIECQLPEPSLDDQRADWERVAEELQKKRVCVDEPPFPALECLSQDLRSGQWHIEAIVEGDKLLRFRPLCTEPLYGFAIDLGTTTIDIALHDLTTGTRLTRKTLLNRQATFGADVVSRAQHFHGDSTPVRDAALDTIREGAGTILNETGVKPTEIYRTVVVGNPIMIHILHGLDPHQLTLAPYAPVVTGMLRRSPVDFGWMFQKHGYVETLPLISAFVGADTVGMIVALDLERETDTTVSIDVGTNGELVLCSKGKLTVTSTAAGPAFEGAQIACGMRALPGSVYSVRIDEAGDLTYQIIGDSPPRGLCGTGLISAVAQLVATGIVDPSGRLIEPSGVGSEGLRSRLFDQDGQKAFAICDDRSVYITQKDIRELQLAKGAVRTGLESLLAESGIDVLNIDRIRLAGNFGAGVNVDDAMRIGLIPRMPPEKIDAVGNAALRGAALALVSADARQRARHTPSISRFLELAGRPEFQMLFAESMMFG